jgi:MOSC domain-containing protein YiiM
MTGTVLSLNVGRPVPVPHRGGMVSTGIFKSAVPDRLRLTRDGFDGDEQADPSVHGGHHKAVYLYSADDYAWWREHLGHNVEHGEFGENLTVTGFTDGEVNVNDQLRVGEALLEVTTPREPCFKLGIRMGDPKFPARFREANRTGFYARVLEEGTVGTGDTVERIATADYSLTIAEFHLTYTTGRTDEPALRRLMATAGLEPDWVDWCERRLAELPR